MSVSEPYPDTASTPAPDAFGCVVHRTGRGAVWLRLRGELDLNAAAQLQAHLSDALSSAELILVDLRELTFMDSAGLAVILAAGGRARRGERRVVFLRGPAQVSRLMALAGAAKQLEIRDLRPIYTAPRAPASVESSAHARASVRRDDAPGSVARRGCSAPAHTATPGDSSPSCEPHGLPELERTAMRGVGSRLRRVALEELWPRRQACEVREELVSRLLPLARRLAYRYRNAHEPLEDLVQVASVGLLGAIDRFDPDRGTTFASFAIPTILGELKRHFRDTGWAAHVPRGAQELALRVDQATRELTAQTGRAPRVDTLAAHLGIPLEDVLLGLDAGMAHYSAALEAPAPGGSPEEVLTLADTLGAEDERIGLTEAKLALAAAIPRLPHLERQAITLRISRDIKQSDIAAQMGCSQMQVSRLLHRAAATLRDLTDLRLSDHRDMT